ncbi:conserved hypothetical protein [Chlamydia pneumoniae LPCoLN]|nr:hypothetical protein [Chlamydia pneumoniae]ACZ33233.1 conserved hypothetical protein [Chlamydia pneumoniae LPCoLN]
MSNPTPKTKISIPTFVRFNVQSINLTEDQKKTALTVGGKVTTENTVVGGDLTCTDGGLTCQSDLTIQKDINIRPTSTNSMVFDGRLNLSNSPLSYKNSQGQDITDYEKISSGKPQEYVPFGYYKRTQIMMAQRGATSSGHVGSGSVPSGSYVPWNKFDQTSVQKTSGTEIYIDPNDGTKLVFEVNSKVPKLFRISIIMAKNGSWLDNGTGADVLLAANEYEQSGGKIKVTELAMTSSRGTSYYETRPLQVVCVTYYAKNNGYFTFQNRAGGGFRVSFFSWNIVSLPYVE